MQVNKSLLIAFMNSYLSRIISRPDSMQARDSDANTCSSFLGLSGLENSEEGCKLVVSANLERISKEEPLFGLAIAAGAVCGYTLSDARAREIRLSALISLCLDMDPVEAHWMGVLAGQCTSENAQSPVAFHSALTDVIRHHRLHHLFCPGESGDHHRSITPSALNKRTGHIHAEEMALWRENFRAMAPESQMMAATIIWLYQSGPDSTWLRRVPCTWTAMEALTYMRDAGCLSQWLRLLATYPGW
ncbi:hypothetical protein [Undibacterium sp.]|uniref:hypothetical protein n=1 Tax=Undibacterium sp. TaxID=1914977 RepID=UPI00374CD9D0